MSAILSADDLNDFISPGVACIKPVETLPRQPDDPEAQYQVTTEDQIANAAPAHISLTDCLACAGCVTSAEAVLVSLQSHAEVLSVLQAEGVPVEELKAKCVKAAASQGGGDALMKANGLLNGIENGIIGIANGDQTDKTFSQHTNGDHQPIPLPNGRIFVATISPQVRASLAATYGTTEREAGYMIEQLLCGPDGIGGARGNRFAWAIDTNAMRSLALALEAEEVTRTQSQGAATRTPRKLPLLTSACPGWICYAEKKQPHVLPHLSPLKSPQALTGTLVKSVLSRQLGVDPSRIWHLAIMPCFDKKLEAARGELTDVQWHQFPNPAEQRTPVRDVDCVITAREILMLADERGISFPSLPRIGLPSTSRIPFPDARLGAFLFDPPRNGDATRGTSDGFLSHVLAAQKAARPGSAVTVKPGRNADVVEFEVSRDGVTHFRAARFYGFRNIQNLVRKLCPPRPSRLPGGKGGTRRPMGKANRTTNGSAVSANGTSTTEYGYVEVMACPGGCTNGGGQIKVDDLSTLRAARMGVASQKEWLAMVDEAYFSMDEEDANAMDIQHDSDANAMDTRDDSRPPDSTDQDIIDGISHRAMADLVAYWARLTGVSAETLLHTTFNAVESEIGVSKGRETEHVVELASKIGGGW